MTDPDWEPVMKRAAAIVTDRGGRTCHAAIVSRELGVPAIVGTGTGTASITTGEDVTVSCAEGDDGLRLPRQRCPFDVERTNLADLPRPRTQDHDERRRTRPRRSRCRSCPTTASAWRASSSSSATHVARAPDGAAAPRAGLPTRRQRAEIERAHAPATPTSGQYFVDRLAEGVAMIAAAF